MLSINEVYSKQGSISGFQFNEETKNVLIHVADILIPLQNWIDSKSYNPYSTADTNICLPWRKGKEQLNTEKFNLVPFIESIIRESPCDLLLLDRWNLLRRIPFDACPIANTKSWRKNKGLEENSVFGIFESGNFLEDKNEGKPIVRSIFYLSGSVNLLKAAQDSQPKTTEEWEEFVELLRKGRHQSWSTEEVPSSISFLVQFTRDILYCMMGMHNASTEPWSTALLIELGEYRRVGNKYSSIDTMRAVESFKQVLNECKEECM